MCYAIPGKVIEINDDIVTVDYFGEIKKARNGFYELSMGDYVYAQGGLVIQKISEEEAIPILQTWREVFFKLQETDLNLTREPKDLYQIANSVRQKHLGNSCCVHGIIEFSNYCRNNCLYCGLRKDNNRLQRYRMETEEIVNVCDYAVNKLGFKAIVLQSGEDIWYNKKRLVEIVEKIREKCSILLVLSIGERELDIYEKLYEVGARGILIRFETGNSELYMKYRPGHVLKERLGLIENLREIGYLIFTGFLIGLPGQTEEDILNDIHLTNSIGAEMFSFGPFIPHPDTPLTDGKFPPHLNPPPLRGEEIGESDSIKLPQLDLVLTTIARARTLYPEAKILITTALETLNKENGAKLGLLAGANSLMINVTPKKYQKLYELYPNRAGAEEEINERISKVLQLLYTLGRAPTDIGI